MEIVPATGSRFSQWTRRQAAMTLTVFVGLVVWGTVVNDKVPKGYLSPGPGKTDAALYQGITARMIHGSGYYQAVDALQAVRGYPTRPFVAVREPTLAWATSVVGSVHTMWLIYLVLAAVVGAAMLVRLERVAPGRKSWWAACILFAVAIAPLLGRQSAVLHEFWTGFLLTLALALTTAKRWRAGLVLATVALFIRELALPMLGLMAIFEFLNGRRKRAFVWVVAIVAFLAFLGLHAWNVDRSVAPAPVGSPGWIDFGLWPFFVNTVRYTTILQLAPLWVTAVAAPAALLGWFSRRGDFADRITLVLVGYVVAYAVVGRPGSLYWGLLYVLFLAPGLAFAPVAFRDLARRMRAAPD